MEFFASIGAHLAGAYAQILGFWLKYSVYFMIIGLVIALLNCFFGYKLRKLWSILGGLFAGLLLGSYLTNRFHMHSFMQTIVILGTGILIALIAFLLYKAGLFLLIAGVSTFLLWHFLPGASVNRLGIYLVIGIVLGALTLAKERIFVSFITALGGGFAGSALLLTLIGHNNRFFIILLGAILAVLGLILQTKPWKDAEYWMETEAREKEDQLRRHREREARHLQEKRERKLDRKYQKEQDRADALYERELAKRDAREERERRAMARERRLMEEERYRRHPDFYEDDYEEEYDTRYGERYDTPYDERYDTRYDERYDTRYDEPYDTRYDERYDTRYDERYDTPYDEQYDAHYDEKDPDVIDLSDVRRALSEEVSQIYSQKREDALPKEDPIGTEDYGASDRTLIYRNK